MFSQEAKEYAQATSPELANPMWKDNAQVIDAWVDFLGYDNRDEYLYQEYGIDSEQALTPQEKLMVLYQLGVFASGET